MSGSTRDPQLGDAETISGEPTWTREGPRKLADKGDAPEPEKVGRYLIVERLGAGGMGVVYRGYDPDLDRRVALKLIRWYDPEGDSPERRSRLLREAQALAKLSHPNVVQVYDVGTHEEQVYIAMEFVDGQTLRDWLGTDAAKDWREVIRVFRRAGRGLAAAHAEELVHRDFKPENVLIAERGDVRVLDFGLARLVGTTRPQRPPKDISQSLESPMTETGSVLGTPLYMAPEQLDGGSVDDRADQFSYCVALWEALYGERPFDESSFMARAAAVSDGKVREVPRGRPVPKWLHAVVRRGLEVEPDDRHASMAALLQALNDDPGRTARRWAVGLSAAFVGAMAWLAIGGAPQTLCSGVEQELVGTWDEPRRAQVEAAMLSSETPYARAAWSSFSAVADGYTRAWTEQYVRACEATHVRRTQSEEDMTVQVDCLRQQLLRVRTIVDALAAQESGVEERAVVAIESVGRPNSCLDPARPETRLAAPPPDAVEEVAAVRESLQVLRTEAGLRQRSPDDATLEGLRARADATGYRPLIAEVGFAIGRYASEDSDYDAARTDLEAAYFHALATGHDRIMFYAATQLARTVGDYLQRPAEGVTWVRHAEGALDRFGHAPREAFELLIARASLASAAGEPEYALALRQQAIALKTEHDPESFQLAYELGNVAIDYAALAQLDDAREAGERSLTLLEERLGSVHPELAPVLVTLGSVANESERDAEAIQLYERAIAIYEQTIGLEHSIVSYPLNNLGYLRYQQGRYAEAEKHLTAALELRERTLGPTHRKVVYPLRNLAMVYRDTERLDEALPLMERALELELQSLGDAHPDIPVGRFDLARLLVFTDPQRARTQAKLARTSFADTGREDQAAEVTRWLERQAATPEP